MSSRFHMNVDPFPSRTMHCLNIYSLHLSMLLMLWLTGIYICIHTYTGSRRLNIRKHISALTFCCEERALLETCFHYTGLVCMRVKQVTRCWPGKRKRLSREPCGDVLGGGVALTLEGLLCWKCAGEEGAEEVADDGLLLESNWFKLEVGSC